MQVKDWSVMTEPRISTHLAPFSPGVRSICPVGLPTGNRYLETRIRQANGSRFKGIELNFRSSITEQTAGTIQKLLEEVGLECANVSMNVWGHAIWKDGSLSNADKQVRHEAIDLIIAGMGTLPNRSAVH
jgi:hypothetical protein